MKYGENECLTEQHKARFERVRHTRLEVLILKSTFDVIPVPIPTFFSI